MFFSLDGGDGTGKSTQTELLCEWLRERGHEVVACRDPGSTALGEAIRGLLLDRHDLLAQVARLVGSDRPLPPRSDASRVSVMDCDNLRALGWVPGGLPLLAENLPGMISPSG